MLQNIGSTPPAGGVRIFPAGPAPSAAAIGLKPFSPVSAPQHHQPLTKVSSLNLIQLFFFHFLSNVLILMD